jgi:hypothetical protein
MHTVNVLERQVGQLVHFERLELQDRCATHRITPKDFYIYRFMSHASPWMPQKQLFVFISAYISRLCGGLLQEECGTQLEVFEGEPIKCQGAQLWNVALPALH